MNLLVNDPNLTWVHSPVLLRYRSSNSQLLTQTRVNPEIWDIAKKQTRSMDSRLQALQDTLINGLIPLADLIGKVGESLDSGTAMPTKEALWEGLSSPLLLAVERD